MIEHLRKTSTTYECFLRDGQRLLASQPDRNEAITLLIETFKFPTVGAVESGHRRKTKKSLKVKACRREDFKRDVLFMFFIIYSFRQPNHHKHYLNFFFLNFSVLNGSVVAWHSENSSKAITELRIKLCQGVKTRSRFGPDSFCLFIQNLALRSA